MNTDTMIGAVVTLIVGLGGGAVVAWMNRNKTNAEANSVAIGGQLQIVDRTMEWNQQLLAERDANMQRFAELEAKFEVRFAAMEKEIQSLEMENRQLRERCRKLEKENARLTNLDS